MNFIFKSKSVGFGSPETTMEFEADDINDVMMYFTDFLRGAGYTFDGVVDIVDSNYEDDYSDPVDEDCESHQEASSSTWPFPLGRPKENTTEDELPFANWGGEKCSLCGMTREEMGQSICYDVRCGLGLNRV
jgi:hypothetical protein